MKDKILETKVTAAVEIIARALRAYTDRPMSCRIYVETRIPAKNGGDAYGIRCRQKRPYVPIMEKVNDITYTIDADGCELILKTEAVENDTQG